MDSLGITSQGGASRWYEELEGNIGKIKHSEYINKSKREASLILPRLLFTLISFYQ